MDKRWEMSRHVRSKWRWDYGRTVREETEGRKTGNRCRVMQTDTHKKKEKITLVEHKWIVTYNFTYMHSLNHAPVQRWGIGTRRG